MQKIVAIILPALFVLSACGSAKTDTNTTPMTETNTKTSQIQTDSGNTSDTGSEDNEIVNIEPNDTSATSSGISEESSGSLQENPAISTESGSVSSDSGSVSSEDESGILAAFQEQYQNKDPELQQTMVLKTISLEDGKYFKGSIDLGSRSIDNVFALKKDDAWKIISFGDTASNCQWLASFPADMITECAAATASGQTSSGSEMGSEEIQN